MYFTICIPSFNRADKIERTLNSLKEQTFKDFELLVVDDGSTDNTKEIVERCIDSIKCDNAKYIYKSNEGKHSAINVGIDNAQGKFFIILDSDDALVFNGLEILYKLCLKIENDELYSGVLARCMNIETKELIGKKIPDNIDSLSYIDMHFHVGMKNYDLGDCCECNKTKIMKKYRFPLDSNMKFVPEAWLFDQIGLYHLLLCTNQIVEVKEYLPNGITNDSRFKEKNIIGFLYHYVSRIEVILPNINASIFIEIVSWWRYWETVKLDNQKMGPRVKKITFLGMLTRFLCPIINIVFKIKYRNIYNKGR